MKIQDILNETWKAIESCDEAHFPAMLRWAEELEKKLPKTAHDGFVVCCIRLEEQRRKEPHHEC